MEERLTEERDNIKLEVSLQGGEALAGSVTTLETAGEEAKGNGPVPCLMAACFLAETGGLSDPFLFLLLGAMIQKRKEKKQEMKRRKNMSEEKNIYIKEKEDGISLNHTEIRVEKWAQVLHVLKHTANLR